MSLGLAFAAHGAEDSSGNSSRYFAVLVAAQDYPSLEPHRQLRGANNDVALIRDILLRQGFRSTDITVIAGRLPYASAPPTRQAILQALRSLVEPGRLAPGDFVYLHFAGHGSRQPAPRLSRAHPADAPWTQEADGLDEIFLPVDTGRWDAATGSVANAIVDDEVAELVGVLRERGAFVWLVFDSCHSGNMARGGESDSEVDRVVLPSELGVPDSLQDASRGLPGPIGHSVPAREASVLESSRSHATAGHGGYVGFFASQTTETTPEMRLPVGDPARKSYGLFSFALARALESGALSGRSYRQLAQSVLQYYAGLGRIGPTPLFEGDLDESVFGQVRNGLPARQWPIVERADGLEIGAGTINELGPGTLMAVVPTPLADPEDTIGIVRIERSSVLASVAVWVEEPEALARAGVSLPPGARLSARQELPAGAYARLLAAPVKFAIRVATARACSRLTGERGCRVDPAASSAEREALARATAALERVSRSVPGHLQVGVAPDEADIALLVHRGRLWFVPRGSELRPDGVAPTYSIALDMHDPTGIDAPLARSLVSIGKTINLSRLAGELNGGNVGLSVGLTVTRAGAPDAPASERITPEQIPEFGVGDRLTFELVNRSRAPVDVTMLLVDAEFAITPVFPFRPGESNRLEPGGKVTIPGSIDVRGHAGLERMLVIGVAARPNSELQNFAYLAQPGLAAEVRRSGPPTSVAALLEQAGLAQPATRGGFVRSADASDVSITTFAWYAP